MEFPDAENDNAFYYLAHCYPYTFTDLCLDLDALTSDEQRSKVMRKEVLCQTRAGNSCFLLTITDFDSDVLTNKPKQAVVVTGRVHPGETNSSWVMKGLLSYLTGTTPSAKALRRSYIFKVIPMLNPDGVIVGNYRCSLSGHDLNRNYRHPNRQSFPTVWHLKQMVADLTHTTQVTLYCDLHGHSRRQNLFMYGCSEINSTTEHVTRDFLKTRLFPWLMSQKAPDKFSFDLCKFTIRPSKESTGRVVMFRQLNILNSFTLETTFCGTTLQNGVERHLNLNDLQSVGRLLGEVSLDFNRTQYDQQFQIEILFKLSRYMTDQLIHTSRLPLETAADNDCLHPVTVNDITATDVVSLSDVTRHRVTVTSSSVSDTFAMTTSVADVASLDNMDSCLKLMDKLKERFVESDSSSSDTDSEPEMMLRSHLKKSTKRRNKRRSQKKHSEVQSKSGTSSVGDVVNVVSQQTTTTSQSTCTLPAISVSETQSTKHQQETDQQHRKHFAKSFPLYVNKYEGRTNGGIPCFSEERLRKRIARKAEKQQLDYTDSLNTGCVQLMMDDVTRHDVTPLEPSVDILTRLGYPRPATRSSIAANCWLRPIGQLVTDLSIDGGHKRQHNKTLSTT
jgi:hypothetical protein